MQTADHQAYQLISNLLHGQWTSAVPYCDAGPGLIYVALLHILHMYTI